MRGFIVFCLLLSFVSLVESGSYCYQKLSDAQDAFNKALGITGANWFSAGSLRNQVRVHYMSDPPNGMRTVCTAAQEFKNVLRDDYGRCVRVIELIRNDDGTATNVTEVMAKEYFYTMVAFDFTCGAGFAVFVNDPTFCIAGTFNTSAETLQQCDQTYGYQATNGDPSMLCNYIKNDLDCYVNAFQKCGDLGKFFGCEYVRTSLLFGHPYFGIADAQFPGNGTCDKLGVCFNNFAMALNLTTSTPWRNPREFRSEIERVYERGSQNGFLSLCQAFRGLRDCLGFEYRRCLSVPTFATGGSNTVQDAYDFIGVFSQAHFTCGAGFDVFYRNEQCISQSWSSNRGRFEACYNDYHAQIAAGGVNAACIAGQQLSECFEFIFSQQCSSARTDVIWWGCEYARTFMFTQFPRCSQRCTTMIVGGGV